MADTKPFRIAAGSPEAFRAGDEGLSVAEINTRTRYQSTVALLSHTEEADPYFSPLQTTKERYHLLRINTVALVGEKHRRHYEERERERSGQCCSTELEVERSSTSFQAAGKETDGS